MVIRLANHYTYGILPSSSSSGVSDVPVMDNEPKFEVEVIIFGFAIFLVILILK